MQVIPTDFVNMIFFQGIQMSVLPSCPYDLHSIRIHFATYTDPADSSSRITRQKIHFMFILIFT
jgi:hypothetical protein